MGKLLATILAVILGFIGTMVLSRIPVNVMASEDVRDERSVDMTTFESNSNNFVEVDGIRFETLIPQTMVRLPKYGEETPVQFGVRITNQTSKPYRFDLQRFLPEILNSDGEIMEVPLNQNAFREVEKFDIPLLMPGESLEFLIDAKFNWYKQNILRFTGNANYGGIWICWNFQPGEYLIRLKYDNQLLTKKMLISPKGWTDIGEFWIGNIKTPFAVLILK
jgi:hypothetical protein